MVPVQVALVSVGAGLSAAAVAVLVHHWRGHGPRSGGVVEGAPRCFEPGAVCRTGGVNHEAVVVCLLAGGAMCYACAWAHGA